MNKLQGNIAKLMTLLLFTTRLKPMIYTNIKIPDSLSLINHRSTR